MRFLLKETEAIHSKASSRTKDRNTWPSIRRVCENAQRDGGPARREHASRSSGGHEQFADQGAAMVEAAASTARPVTVTRTLSEAGVGTQCVIAWSETGCE